jgi:hypothetical protein
MGYLKVKNVALDIPFINEEYSTLDLYQIADKLKDQGFSVKIKPSRFDKGMYDVTHLGGDIDDLQSALNDIFGRDGYRIIFDEAKKKKTQKKDPPIGKPKRGGSKAYYVYVKDGDKVKKVSFGSGGLRAKINNPEARRAFAARHNCDKKKDRTKAGYWSCNLPRYAKALGLGANKNTFW